MYCLLGKPARHSLSPAMHNAGFIARKLDCTYLAFEPDNLQAAVLGLRSMGAAGFNVTMPFKSEIISMVDELDEMAQRIGAVNTVVNSNGILKGYNTDGIGAVAALKKATKISGKRILLFGAGGAGKAIAHYMKKEGAELAVADRNIDRAEGLAAAVGGKAIHADGVGSLEGFDIIINASPAGMKPNTSEIPVGAKLLKKGMVVFDIVYEPAHTRLLKEARKRGCKTVSGVEMLLEQGYAAFELFTGKSAPKKEMRKAVLGALK